MAGSLQDHPSAGVSPHLVELSQNVAQRAFDEHATRAQPSV